MGSICCQGKVSAMQLFSILDRVLKYRTEIGVVKSNNWNIWHWDSSSMGGLAQNIYFLSDFFPIKERLFLLFNRSGSCYSAGMYRTRTLDTHQELQPTSTWKATEFIICCHWDTHVFMGSYLKLDFWRSIKPSLSHGCPMPVYMWYIGVVCWDLPNVLSLWKGIHHFISN